jgi:CRISPR-associated protein Csb2
MPTLLLQFPGRRYHATPWGAHVNEGLVEWPPSPWRILRALLATGYCTRNWSGSELPPTARTMIEKLSSVAPTYRLPPASGSHSRHYMPLALLKDGREKTTLVFDTWAQIDTDTLAVHWDVDLGTEETDELAALARGLGYLGRSESWVECTLVDGVDQAEFTVRPGEASDGLRQHWEQTALLAPLSPPDYAAWRRKALEGAIDGTGIDVANPRLSLRDTTRLAAIEAQFPTDLIACLQVETGWLQRLGWNQPPGSHKLLYWRPTNCLEAGAPKPRAAVRRAAAVDAMLLSITSASGNDHALPRVERTLPQGELLHRALVANAARLGDHSVVLSGRDAARKPLTMPHRHAHLLHLDLDGDGHLDHVLVWAPMGLDADAQSAVRATRSTYTKGGTAPLRLALAGSGAIADMLHLPPPQGLALDRLVGGIDGSRVWRSISPFVPPRHLKCRGRNTLAGQINAELSARALPIARDTVVLDPRDDECARQARHFKRSRGRGPQPPQDTGFMLELHFDAPVFGPLALGYGSHFGLGLFMAAGK